MSSRHIHTVALLMGMALLAQSGCVRPVAAPPAVAPVVASDPTPAKEVTTLFLAGIDAFNAHDLDRFLEQFAEDVEMYAPTGWLRGKSAVRERFASTFDQFPAGRMEVEDLNAREVAPQSVVVDFRWIYLRQPIPATRV